MAALFKVGVEHNKRPMAFEIEGRKAGKKSVICINQWTSAKLLADTRSIMCDAKREGVEKTFLTRWSLFEAPSALWPRTDEPIEADGLALTLSSVEAVRLRVSKLK